MYDRKRVEFLGQMNGLLSVYYGEQLRNLHKVSLTGFKKALNTFSSLSGLDHDNLFITKLKFAADQAESLFTNGAQGKFISLEFRCAKII